MAHPEIIVGATDIVMVADMSLPSLRDVNRLRRFFKASDFEGRVLLTANLANSGRKGQLTKAEFEKGLEGQIDHVIPFDEKSAAKASNIGTPLGALGRPATVTALTELTSALTGIASVKRKLWSFKKK